MKRYPIPEAIDGARDWSVSESGSGTPRCSLGERALWVPLGGVCGRCGVDHARIIRQHEMTHAAISPRDPAALRVDGVQPMTLLAIEDRRIEQRMMREGLRPDGPGMCAEDLTATARVQAHDGLRAATLYAVCAPDRDAERLIFEAIAEADPTSDGRFTNRVRALVSGVDDILSERGADTRPGFERTVLAAQWLERWLEQSEEDGTQPGDEGDEEDGEEDDEPGEDGLGPLAKLGWEDDEHDVDGRIGDPVWGDLRVEEPGRPVSVEAAKNVQRWRTVESGSILRRPDRLLSDRRIFGRRLRHAGGTVLVDGSGSMAAVTPAILEEACTAAPAALVAVYASTDSMGTLRVLMRDGKRVPDDGLECSDMGGANRCDGNALDWLARQPGPRVWVSDGGVSEAWPDGGGERFTERAMLDAARRQRAAGIVRVKTLEDAVRVLDGRARRGRKGEAA